MGHGRREEDSVVVEKTVDAAIGGGHGDAMFTELWGGCRGREKDVQLGDGDLGDGHQTHGEEDDNEVEGIAANERAIAHTSPDPVYDLRQSQADLDLFCSITYKGPEARDVLRTVTPWQN
jgi:hypothetical protein